MTDCDLLVTEGRMLALDRDSGVVDDGALAITGHRIVDVGGARELAARWTPGRTIDAEGGVVTPGFVDAHVHLAAFLAGAAPYLRRTEPSLFSGGSRVSEIVPMVARMTSAPVPAQITASVLRPVLAAMVRSGITSVVDAGSSGLDGLVTAASDVGIRAAIGPSLADRWHDESGQLAQQADAGELLDAAREWVGAHDGAGDGRVRALVSAVETIACSDELLRGIAELAEASDISTHVHSHITEASDAAHHQAYARSATDRLADAGMLTARCTLMHAGNATASDIGRFASSGVTVNHNPLGNAMLGFATVAQGAVPAMVEAGVPLVLGSDYAPSMVATPFDMVRAGLAVHREAHGSDVAMVEEDILRMATNPGVPVGRPGEVGRLEVGQLADVVVVDTSGPHHLGDRHPVPSLALRARADDVRFVIIDGQVIVDDRRLTTLDEQDALAEARATFAHLA